jgi:MEMO1 family protein
MVKRESLFAGSFYPLYKDEIEKYIQNNAENVETKYDAISIISPHAGYVYSGKTALSVYSRINIPENVIIIGPNHTGIGESVSIYNKGVWETPLGDVEIETNIANNILNNSKYAKSDFSAHSEEHSIEVQLPMIQSFNRNIKLIPIIMKNYSLPVIEDLAEAIFKGSSNTKTLVIASSDMSHYIPRKVAKELDYIAFDKINNLDYIGLMKVVNENNIPMCGLGPVSVAIAYSRMKDAKRATLINYTDSGEITLDIDSVVSYVSYLIL